MTKPKKTALSQDWGWAGKLKGISGGGEISTTYRGRGSDDLVRAEMEKNTAPRELTGIQLRQNRSQERRGVGKKPDTEKRQKVALLTRDFVRG